MLVMAGAIAIFVSGLNRIDEEKISAIAQLASAFASLTDIDAEQSIVARITADLEGFKDTMDVALQSQVASLSNFQDVKSMTQTRAQTSVQNQVQMPERLVVEATNTIHTQIGNQDFNTAVKKSINEAKWGKFDKGPEKIAAAGHAAG